MSTLQKCIFVGDQAPNFQAESSQGRLDFHQYIEGKWAVLFSHPKDFTPVCTSELGRVAQLRKEWEKRDVKVVALSCDSVESHKNWIKDIEELHKCQVDYPIIADEDRSVAMTYGMLDASSRGDELPLTVRSLFVIDPSKRIKLILTYPASTGRNFDELLRAIDSLQLTSKHKLATPADWKRGEQCVIAPTMSDEEARQSYPGFTKLKPYLRMTKDPISA